MKRPRTSGQDAYKLQPFGSGTCSILGVFLRIRLRRSKLFRNYQASSMQTIYYLAQQLLVHQPESNGMAQQQEHRCKTLPLHSTAVINRIRARSQMNTPMSSTWHAATASFPFVLYSRKALSFFESLSSAIVCARTAHNFFLQSFSKLLIIIIQNVSKLAMAATIGRIVLVVGGGYVGTALYAYKDNFPQFFGGAFRDFANLLKISNGGGGNGSSVEGKVDMLTQDVRALMLSGRGGTIVLTSPQGSLMTKVQMFNGCK